MNTTIRFEPDPSLDHVEVLIRAPEKDEDVETLMEKLSGHPPETLTVFDENGNLRKLREEEIIRVSVEGKLLNITTEDGSWYLRRTLQSLEADLDPQRFLRISRYELVNLNKVLRYDFTIVGALMLELPGGVQAWASRRCIPAIRSRLLGRR